MANVIPGVPPSYNKNDLQGTVKALCNYIRSYQENVDFILSQIRKDTSNEGITETLEEIEEQLSEHEIKIKSLQDDMSVLGSE